MKNIDKVNYLIRNLKDSGMSVKEVSDTHHTFGQYIDMRNTLFCALCNAYPDISWKSKKHYNEADDPMFNGDFIAGINTPEGVVTFHLKMIYWDELCVNEIDHAPKYDGYGEDEVRARVLSLKRNTNGNLQ